MKEIRWEKMMFNLSSDENHTIESNDSYDEDGEHGQHILMPMIPMNEPKIMTPMGALYPERPYDMIHDTEMFIGYTNFDISKSTEIIKNVEGVETASAYSRYRMMVCVGPMFDSGEVLENIESILTGQQKLIDSLRDQLDESIKKIHPEADKWIAYIYPNSKLYYVISTDEEWKNIDRLMEKFSMMEKLSGGNTLYKM